MTVLDLCHELPQKTFAAGETILEEGARAGVLYVLREGEVEVLKGDFQITTVAESGSFFGEMSVLLSMPHMATVISFLGFLKFSIQCFHLAMSGGL